MNRSNPMHLMHTPYARNGAHSVQTDIKEESLRIPLKENKEAPSSLSVFLGNQNPSVKV